MTAAGPDAPDRARRTDLGQFLRARRDAIDPADVGLAPGTRRRTPGLRREEVAMLAGVSVSWYTWLEQGRPINPSADVLHALARVLRLDDASTAHLLALADPGPSPGSAPAPPSDSAGGDPVPATLWRLLDALDPHPAYVLGPRWDHLAWNRAFERLFPAIGSLPDERRNLVWVVFAEPAARALIVDWEPEAQRVLAQFRADTVTHRHDPEMADLVERLHAASPEFRAWWPQHDVSAADTRVRRFAHPDAGSLAFAFQQLVPADAPDLRVIVHLPLTDDDSALRLQKPDGPLEA